jgi:hypothetical protein
MEVSLELLAVGIILLAISLAAWVKRVVKGAPAYALVGFAFLFVILAFDPLSDMVLIWILAMDLGLIGAAVTKGPLPRLYLLIGIGVMLLSFILLNIRQGFIG